jgi:hypothetical protein
MAELPDRDEMIRRLEDHIGRRLSAVELGQLDLAMSEISKPTSTRDDSGKIRTVVHYSYMLMCLVGAVIGFSSPSAPWGGVFIFVGIALFILSHFAWTWLLYAAVACSIVAFPVMLTTTLVPRQEYGWLAASGLGFLVLAGLGAHVAAKEESPADGVFAFLSGIGGIIMLVWAAVGAAR